METIQQFINRNISTYQQHGNVSEETIAKYDKLFKGKFPQEIIWIWRNMGFGVFEDGYLQIVNPEEYAFAFDYVDKILEPTIIWGITALGDLLLWEGNKNWTISEDEGNRVKIINIRKCQSRALNSMQGTLDVFFDEYFIGHKNYFDSKAFLEIKGKMLKLEYGQCYGYVPALSLGGKVSNNNLQIVDVKSYIEVIGQSVGKIIDLG